MKRLFALILSLMLLVPVASAGTADVLTYESRDQDALRFANAFGDEVVLRLAPSQTAPEFRTGRSYRVVTEDNVFLYAEEAHPETAIGVFVDQAMHSVAFMGPRGELMSFFRQISPGVMTFEGALIEGQPYRLTYLGEKLYDMEEVEVKTLTGVVANFSSDSLEIESDGEFYRFDAIPLTYLTDSADFLTPGQTVAVSYAGDRLLSAETKN